MATEIPVGLFNYENGGRTSDGSYNFRGLQQTFEAAEAPTIILINEAKGWKANGKCRLAYGR